MRNPARRSIGSKTPSGSRAECWKTRSLRMRRAQIVPVCGYKRYVMTSQDPELLRRLLRAKDRMDAASHEEWPVDRLARVSHVSEAHFARSFKDAFGVPPHRYLLTRRIERATALLRDTELSVTDIAFQTGWKSLGTFGRTFRDVTGESPGELRERERAAQHNPERVPACILSAAHRPNLTSAVSEKRRQKADDINDSTEKAEVL